MGVDNHLKEVEEFLEFLRTKYCDAWLASTTLLVAGIVEKYKIAEWDVGKFRIESDMRRKKLFQEVDETKSFVQIVAKDPSFNNINLCF